MPEKNQEELERIVKAVVKIQNSNIWQEQGLVIVQKVGHWEQEVEAQTLL